ncbi:hypothetical protein SAMN06295970_108153 [Noviherbaspirillum suwonense]|jgi:hypothetical protein|uniref:Uncharacterized protein n=1 Tax=Noviherbaspirillum suwonense TaxID=1224511 RepID=A0ABY1QBS1_9BURK|nr:hypothetical protein SAMN06295970_108153 [Noviherbaspirillum suwonense]
MSEPNKSTGEQSGAKKREYHQEAHAVRTWMVNAKLP